MAFKYECSNSENAASGARGFHGRGNGKPRAKKCAYCGSAWYIEEGQWGVFVWSGGRGDYRRDNALNLFEQPAKAESFADDHTQDNYVVRWVWSGSA